LDLAGAQGLGACLAPAALPGLRTLQLSWITDLPLPQLLLLLEGMPGLHRFVMAHTPVVTDAFLPALARRCPRLAELAIAFSPSLTGPMALLSSPLLSPCPAGPPVPGAPESGAVLFPHLETLDMRGCFSDEAAPPAWAGEEPRRDAILAWVVERHLVRGCRVRSALGDQGGESAVLWGNGGGGMGQAASWKVQTSS
jgi:hypothetical protein